MRIFPGEIQWLPLKAFSKGPVNISFLNGKTSQAVVVPAQFAASHCCALLLLSTIMVFSVPSSSANSTNVTCGRVSTSLMVVQNFSLSATALTLKLISAVTFCRENCVFY
jgi:hypothetical protein